MQLCSPNSLSFVPTFMVHPGMMMIPLKFRFVLKCIPFTSSAKNFSVKSKQVYRHTAFSSLEKQSSKLHRNFHIVQRFLNAKPTANIIEPEKYDGKNNINKTETRYVKIFAQYVTEGLTFSAERWDRVKEELIQEYDFLNKNNFDGIFMNICCIKKNYSVGKAYIEYLEGTGTKINIAVLSTFLRLCYICCTECDEEQILKIVNILKSKYKIFNAETAENIIQGLSLTSHWKECFDYFQMINISCTPSITVFIAIIIAAFKNKQYDVGWEYLEILTKTTKLFNEQVYFVWIDECQKTRMSELHASKASAVQSRSNSDMMMEKFLYFLAEKLLYPSEDLVHKINHWFESKPGHHWHGKHTAVSKSGICKFCQTKLDDIVVQQEDFIFMQEKMLKLSLEKNDVFVNTTPEELQRFKCFLKQTAPYDVVLDGLNIGYNMSPKRSPHLTSARLLYTVVKCFSDRSMKVLVFGRKHMLNWSAKYIKYIQQHAHLFTIENLSKDDPFLLYATMYSGLGTYFLSHDLFRNYASLLKTAKLQRTFRLWQLKHQMKLQISGYKNISIIYPAQYLPAVQHKENMWHIPFDDGLPQQGIQPPKDWLCLTQIPDIKNRHRI